jgi:hypothetical protein
LPDNPPHGPFALWRGTASPLRSLIFFGAAAGAWHRPGAALIGTSYFCNQPQCVLKLSSKMEQKNLSNLTDEELRKEAKRLKNKPIITAFLIGFLFGIVVFSVAVNSFGFLMLIPLFLIYKLTRPSAEDEALLAVIKERNLEP